MKVRITESVFWDIEGRGLTEHYGIEHLLHAALPATVDMPDEVARDLADDARYQSDPVDAGYGQPFGLRMAYAALARRIAAAEEVS